MDNLLYIACIALGLGSGIWAILLAHRLQRTYGMSSLSTFLYFQIFIAVFGLYGLVGQNVIRKILIHRDSPFLTVETVWHLFSFLGVPFLILAWYMFLRFCREAVDESPPRTFAYSYFFVTAALYLSYGAGIVFLNITASGNTGFPAFSTAAKAVFGIMDSAVIAAAIPRLLILANRLKDRNKKTAVRTFSVFVLTAWSLRLLLYLLSGQNEISLSLFLFFFFAGNLPPLLTWRHYLHRHVSPPQPMTSTGAWDTAKFAAEFGISKREEEVIRHVSEGKTNREISDALFISLQTVKDHLYRIFQKTDVRNRVQLINLVQKYRTIENHQDADS